MRRSFVMVSLLASAALVGVTHANPAPKAKVAAKAEPAPKATGAEIGAFGLDLAGMDTSVQPGDDFVKFAGGKWEAATEIPADKATYGMFNRLADRSLEQTRTILDAAAKRPGDKIGDFYASFMDEAAINAKGIDPIKPWIAEIRAAGDKTALAAEMAKLQRTGVGGLFRMGVGQDDKAPDTYIVGLSQSGIGLPDRDYYLKDDPKLADTRAKYQAYQVQMLGLAGVDDAAARGAAVYAFEKALATAHWDRIKSRDSDLTYNKWSAADFATKAPGFPWEVYMKTAGTAGQANYLVGMPSALTDEAKAFADAPVQVVQDFLILRLLRSYAGVLAKPINDANFAFYGTVLSGAPQQPVRWKRGVGIVSGAMGEQVGQAYVEQYFPPATKAAADQLVKNIIAAMSVRLDNLTWMAPETKVKAHAKLAAFTPKIGYPSKWRDYSALTVKRDDIVANVAAANAFEYERDLHKLGQPIDRTEWGMTPMTVNAYANPPMNEIVFPAAILQPPFFDAKADPAVNYGGIGVVIGHELSHHFDDQGRKYDPTGKLTDWWTAEDVKRFTAMTDKLVKQYDAYEPLPGLHIKGGLTLGENMADLAGLALAYDAYHRSLGGKPAPVIDGLTGDQRFFLGYAQVWRIKFREPALRSQVISNEHSPGPFRTVEVRNVDAWYKAFGVKAGEKLYLAPADRVKVW
ncbi:MULTISPECIES: M13 family metallopeptidase [Sphingomonas]|jgi:putative endopeptidase|uniref:M13-type metalloendopeptidase n=1 Tax=Sphingomonas echinoides TaxID=59803 RepID=A0ABU4PKN5_9SPHN|nr:M13-type metalloendopeptidase [Sphingomonas echinoides]MDX5984544.1 M13-type metalloendopeptidase [Sphingomonas echinoides]